MNISFINQLRPTLRVEEEEEEEEEDENVEPRRKPTYNRADQAFTLRNKVTTEITHYTIITTVGSGHVL